MELKIFFCFKILEISKNGKFKIQKTRKKLKQTVQNFNFFMRQKNIKNSFESKKHKEKLQKNIKKLENNLKKDAI